MHPRFLHLLLAVLATVCASPRTSAQTVPSSEVALRAIVGVLAADSLGGRATGSDGATKAARYIASRLASFGVAPAYPVIPGRDSAYFQRVPMGRLAGGRAARDPALLASFAAFDSLPPDARVWAANVVGIIPGSDPALRNEAIVVAAHYDHVGVGEPVAGDSIYNGADDDASGVAAVLEIARALATGTSPRRTVVILLTTGEELGLLGTRWYIANPRVPLERTVAEFEVEMIGRPDPLVGGAGRTWLTGFGRSTMGEALAARGIRIVDDPRPDQQFFLRSDNIAFACRGIPAHTMSSFGLHEDYHTPDDEVERIDFAHMSIASEAAIAAVRILADGPKVEWKPGGSPVGDSRACGRV